MTRGVLTALVAMAAGISVTAAELQPRTVAAFDRYVRATESETQEPSRFYGWTGCLRRVVRRRSR